MASFRANRSERTGSFGAAPRTKAGLFRSFGVDIPADPPVFSEAADKPESEENLRFRFSHQNKRLKVSSPRVRR